MSRFPTDLATVHEAPDPLSAEAIALILREARIEAFVVQPPPPGFGPILPEGLRRVPVRVHSADLAAARRVLAARVAESADIDWDESDLENPTVRPVSQRGAGHRRMPLLAVFGWLLAASIIVLLLLTVFLMLVTQLTGRKPASSTAHAAPRLTLA